MRAYLVVGCESAGNRITAAVLAQHGCHGEGSFDAPYNTVLPDGSEDPVVVVRSFPHGGVWPDLPEVHGDLRLAGYEVTVLVVTRDQVALQRSLIAHKFVSRPLQAQRQVQEAYNRIFQGLHPSWDWRLVTLEGLCAEGAVPPLMASLGLSKEPLSPLMWQGEPVKHGLHPRPNAKYFPVDYFAGAPS